MVKLFRWLIGTISFTFTGGFNEGFITECRSLGYNLHDIRYRDGALCAVCPAALYPQLRPIAKKHGGRLKMLRKSGVPFILFPYRKRWGLLLGAVLSVAMVAAMSGFIWNIEITGCERIQPQEVLTLLADNGFYEGVQRRRADTDRMESLIMASFRDCAWVHINFTGTTARVELSEAVPHKKKISKKPANLIAKKDGRLIKTTVYDGWAAAKAGDSVVKGDLLISGVYESEAGKMNLFAHARGEYLAEVTEPVSLFVSREQKYRRYEYEQRFRYLRLFCFNLPLFIGSSDRPSAEISLKEKRLTLHGKRLPLGISTKTVKVYTEHSERLSDRALTALAAQELERYKKERLPRCEILADKTETALSADGAQLKGCLICVEDIGKEVTLTE